MAASKAFVQSFERYKKEDTELACKEVDKPYYTLQLSEKNENPLICWPVDDACARE